MSILDLFGLLHDGMLVLGISTAMAMSWKLHRRLDALQDRHRAELHELDLAHRRELARLAMWVTPQPLAPYPPPLEQVGGYRVAPRPSPPPS